MGRGDRGDRHHDQSVTMAARHQGIMMAPPFTAIDWPVPSMFVLYRAFKLKMVAGNPLTASSAPDGVAITRAFARRYFGQDRPLGRILTIRTVEEGAGSRALLFSAPRRTPASFFKKYF